MIPAAFCRHLSTPTRLKDQLLELVELRRTRVLQEAGIGERLARSESGLVNSGCEILRRSERSEGAGPAASRHCGNCEQFPFAVTEARQPPAGGSDLEELLGDLVAGARSQQYLAFCWTAA